MFQQEVGSVPMDTTDVVENEMENNESDEDVDFEPDEKCKVTGSYYPIYFLSHWKEGHTRRDRVPVAILLPSGIVKVSFRIRVPNGGKALELSITWPSPMIDMLQLHSVLLSDSKQN